MLNNEIRVGLAEQVRLEPKIEAFQERDQPVQGSVPTWQVPEPARGPVLLAIEQENNWR